MKRSFHLLVLAMMVLSPLASVAKVVNTGLEGVAECLKSAKPGDRIVISDGIYSDLQLRWTGHGSEGKPVVVEAAHPGKVVVNGRSSLQISGEYLEVSGLAFKDGTVARRAVVEFAIGSNYANHCRLTEMLIDNFGTPRRGENRNYIFLSGRYNRVDHCSFLNKYNLGVTCLVNLNGAGCLNNHHEIDHNYFGPRGVYGSNGAETMRMGTSLQAYETSATQVHDNLYERCNGEVEVISVKSCDNIVKDNVFLECQGVVALRHGKRNTVTGNVFIGHGVRNTGGVRIVDEGHTVSGNRFYGLAGERFFAPLAVMDGVPNSLPNRYVKVSNVAIKDNIYWHCSPLEFGTGKDAERTVAPEGVTFSGNTLVADAGSKPILMVDEASDVTFTNNRTNIDGIGYPGFTKVAKLKVDMPDEAKLRVGKGVSWASNTVSEATVANAETFSATPSDNLQAIVDGMPAGATLNLADGVYLLPQTIKVSKPISITGSSSDAVVLRYAGRNAEPIITIADGGALRVKGLTFSGKLTQGMTVPEAGISTDATMSRPYRLDAEECTFTDFGESGCSAIRGGKNTFADSVVISNCTFSDCSGDGINLAMERDDKGRYNADDIVISGCSFFRFLGIPVNIYRGGSDESTAGPYVKVLGCNFYDCCNKQRGSVLRLIGPQVLEVARCDFDGSGRGGAAMRLDEAVWEKIDLHDCNFYNSGRVLSAFGRTVTGKTNLKPEYVDEAAHDFRMKPGSELYNKEIGKK